jgi:hypothetical protein
MENNISWQAAKKLMDFEKSGSLPSCVGKLDRRKRSKNL